MAKKEPKTPAEIADAAAESSDYLKPADFTGKTFRIDGFDTLETQFGVRHVALVVLNGNGEQQRMWASGVVVTRQLDALGEAGQFPVTVRLEREEGKWYRYHVVEEEPGEKFDTLLEEEGIK